MWVKILLLFFVFSFLFKTDHSFDQDLGRHLKLGQIIIQTRSIPKVNLFSYTNPNFPFINTHWLFEVFTYLTNQAVGSETLLILKIIVFLISVWLVLKLIPKENKVLLLPVGFIFLHVLRERAELRPEVFSFLFTAATYYILEKYLKTFTKLIYLLPIISLIWINTHIYFFVGFILQGIFLAHLAYQCLRNRQKIRDLELLAIIFTISILISLVNPNGLLGLLFPLNVTRNYGYTVVENQTMFLLESINFRDPNFLFVKLSIAVAALSFLVAFLRKKLGIRNILLTSFGIVLALLNVRSFPYLVFLSLPAVLQNFGPIKYNILAKILAVIFAGLLILESYFYLHGDYYRLHDDNNTVSLKLVESSKYALDFVISHQLPGPIYNNFDIGSYIIYKGYSKYEVFVDGRPEAYPREFFFNVYIPTQSDYTKFKDLEKQYDFKTIIFSHTDQTPWAKTFLQSVVQDKDWNTVYLDNFMIILVKNDLAAQMRIPIVDLSTLKPNLFVDDNYMSYLRTGLFLLNIGYHSNGQQFIEKALQIFPNSPVANAVMANLSGQSIYLEKSTNKIFW